MNTRARSGAAATLCAGLIWFAGACMASAAELPGRAALPGPPAAAKASPEELEAKKREYFSDVKLVTHQGKEVRFYTDLLKDKVVIVTFYYLNCGTVCPVQNTILAKLQKLLGDRLGKDIFILSLSVDPERDTPRLVKQYAEVWKPRPGWLFVTGKKVNADWANYKLGGYTGNFESHPTTYLLGNVRTGHWMKLRPDTKADVLARHLQDLAAESAKKP